MSHFPLDQSFLCVDCRCVGDHSGRCACCQSRSLLNLSAILNRVPEPDDIEVELTILAYERSEMLGKQAR